MVTQKYDGSISRLISENYYVRNTHRMLALAKDVCAGMVHLHLHGLIHFDLKPANILYYRRKEDNEGGIDTRKTIIDGIIYVISDLGYARTINTPVKSGWGTIITAGLSIPEDIGLTLRYCSPEILKIFFGSNPGLRISLTEDHLKADVYSFSILLYEVVTGARAWGKVKKEDLTTFIFKGTRPTIEKAVDDLAAKDAVIAELLYIIRAGWHHNPQIRPSFQKIQSILERYP